MYVTVDLTEKADSGQSSFILHNIVKKWKDKPEVGFMLIYFH